MTRRQESCLELGDSTSPADTAEAMMLLLNEGSPQELRLFHPCSAGTVRTAVLEQSAPLHALHYQNHL